MGSNAGSYYLAVTSTKSGTVKGDSTAKVAKDQIEVRSFSFEADRPTDIATGAPAGRIQCKTMEFVIPLGGASAILLNIFFTNENIKTAKLTCYRAGVDGKEERFLEWTFTDARIINYKIASEEHFPYDTFQIVYGKADFTYPKNSTSFIWDGAAPSTT